jgi:hypothetical protein
MAQEKSIKAQAPQDAKKDTLAAKEVACLIGNLADERCQTAVTPWVSTHSASRRLASAASLI